MQQWCRVCGEPAAGFHFGAFTCEGCKSFFGRSCNSGIATLAECKTGGRCIITGKNRTACKSCRLRQCIRAGMSKSGSRYGRRSNWFKIHCLLQDKSPSPASPASRERSGDITTSPSNNDQYIPCSSRKNSSNNEVLRSVSPPVRKKARLDSDANTITLGNQEIRITSIVGDSVTISKESRNDSHVKSVHLTEQKSDTKAQSNDIQNIATEKASAASPFISLQLLHEYSRRLSGGCPNTLESSVCVKPIPNIFLSASKSSSHDEDVSNEEEKQNYPELLKYYRRHFTGYDDCPFDASKVFRGLLSSYLSLKCNAINQTLVKDNSFLHEFEKSSLGNTTQQNFKAEQLEPIDLSVKRRADTIDVQSSADLFTLTDTKEECLQKDCSSRETNDINHNTMKEVIDRLTRGDTIVRNNDEGTEATSNTKTKSESILRNVYQLPPLMDINSIHKLLRLVEYDGNVDSEIITSKNSVSLSNSSVLSTPSSVLSNNRTFVECSFNSNQLSTPSSLVSNDGTFVECSFNSNQLSTPSSLVSNDGTFVDCSFNATEISDNPELKIIHNYNSNIHNDQNVSVS